MSVAREDRHALEVAVHAARADAGGNAVRDWLYSRRDEINTKWYTLSGDELLQAQGEARAWARLIKLIEQGPQIKPTERAAS
jgi:hypothetical protein